MKFGKKFGEWYAYGGRIPRKTKKHFLGVRISSCELKRRLKMVIVGDPIKTMYERVQFEPYGDFCPHCGHIGYVGTGNRTTYPEHWEYFHCLRCRSVVGYIDNSPFIHALECREHNYDPVF